MHARSNLLSLEPRRKKQLLSLMFIHKHRHQNIARVHVRRTRAAQVFSFVREKYNCIKYKNSPYYKGALLWDALPVKAKNSKTLLGFKKHVKSMYMTYDDIIT